MLGVGLNMGRGVMCPFLGGKIQKWMGNMRTGGEIEENVRWNLAGWGHFWSRIPELLFWGYAVIYLTWTYMGMHRWNDAVQPVRLLESDDAKNNNRTNRLCVYQKCIGVPPQMGLSWGTAKWPWVSILSHGHPGLGWFGVLPWLRKAPTATGGRPAPRDPGEVATTQPPGRTFGRRLGKLHDQFSRREAQGGPWICWGAQVPKRTADSGDSFLSIFGSSIG